MPLVDLAVHHAIFGLLRLSLAVIAVVAAVVRGEGDGCDDVLVFLFGFAVVQILGLGVMLVHLPMVSLKNKQRSFANRVFTCKPVAGYVFLGIGAIIAILHLIFLVPIVFILSRDGADSCSDNDFGTWLLIVCIVAFAEIGCTFLMFFILSFFKKETVKGPDSGSGAKAGSKKGQPSVILNPDDSEDMLRLEDPSQFMVNEERAALFLRPGAPNPSSSSSESDSGSMVGGYQQSSGSMSLTGTSTSGTGSLTGSSTPSPSQSLSASASVSASVTDSAPSSTANNPSDDESATSSSSSSSVSSSTSGPASPSLSDSSTAVSISDSRSSSSGSDLSGSLSSGSGTGSSDSYTSSSATS